MQDKFLTIMRKFDIRREKGKARTAEPTAYLYTTIGKATPKLHLHVCTRIEVNVKKWVLLTKGKKQDRLYEWYHSEEGLPVWEKLCQIDKAINDILNRDSAFTDESRMEYNVPFIRKSIDEAVSAIVEAERRQEIEKAVTEYKEQKRKERNTFIFFLGQYVEGILNNTRMQGNEGKPYSEGTKRGWRTFGKVMSDFHSKHPFNWEDIDRPLIDKFIHYLIGEGYSLTTRNGHLKKLHKLMVDADLEGLHDIKVPNLFMNKQAQEKASKKKTAIYLTEDELEALYNFPLEGHFAVSRDAFLVGCYTCQAFAEFSRISGKMLVGNEKDVIRLRRQKTDTPARISLHLPFRYNHLTELLEKYDYNMASLHLYEQHINDDMKAILEQMSESVPSLKAEYETMLTKTEKEMEKAGKVEFVKAENGKAIKKKYELVSTHTARRSGITNLLLTGKYELYDMMEVAGHSKIDQTIEYIKLSGDEIIEYLETHFRTK